MERKKQTLHIGILEPIPLISNILTGEETLDWKEFTIFLFKNQH